MANDRIAAGKASGIARREKAKAKATSFIGRVFGRLTVVELADPIKGHTSVLCECSCGNTKSATISHLIQGRVLSCNCMNDELRSARTRTHGASKTPTYKTWCKMKERCDSPNTEHYSEYGGRGITICERWLVFENFIRDMGERPSTKHSIDRIDNNGNYEPGNCRWATQYEQCANQRTNRLITYKGETRHLSEWARLAGLNKTTLWMRVTKYGWTIERAMTHPLQNPRTKAHDKPPLATQ